MSPAAIGAVWLFALWACTAWGWWRTHRRARRRHGGYLPPTAYTGTNRPTGIYVTHRTAEGCSSMMRLGGQPEEQAWPLTVDETSSYAALTTSGNGTDGARGRTVPEPAGSGDTA